MNAESSSFKDLPLDELSIVPEWARGPSKSFDHHTGQDAPERGRGRDRDRRSDRGPSNRPPRGDRPRPPQGDRRPDRPGGRPGPGAGKGPQRPFKDRGPQRGPQRGPPQDRPSPNRPEPLPTVEGLDVVFVAEDQAFDSMAETMKQTSRAYPLFDVAKLVLYKPERHQVRLTRKPAADGTPRPLWRVVWDGQLFLTRDEATEHLMRRFADRLFRKCETPIDPPKGNFAFVNRCGFTNIWLGPPNYHEYQIRLVRHHQQHLSNVPFDKFKARIQTVKDPEAVQAWLTSMSTKSQYECQLCGGTVEAPSPAATEPTPEVATEPAPAVESTTVAEPVAKPKFDDLVSLQKHLVDQHLATCIESAPSFTLPGPASRQLNHRGISASIRVAWESERRFPLNTVALLRSSLAKHGFAYFKHDKNVTYITKIRRKRFETLDGLADGIRKSVLFLREHPGASRKQLVEHFLGPVTVSAQPAQSVSETVAEPVAAESPVADQPVASTEPAATPAAEATPPAVAPATPADAHLPAPIVTPEDKIMADLHWLIIDGYVVEFSDGRLMAWPDAPSKPEPTAAPEATTEVPAAAEPSVAETTPTTASPAPSESNVAPEPPKDPPPSAV